MSQIGEKLREVRLKRGRTLEEVAEAIGSAATTISKYESGRVRNIPQNKIEAIASFLEVSPSYLLGYGVSEEADPIVLSITEQLMLQEYRSLSHAQQITVNMLVRRLYEVEHTNEGPEQLTL